MKPNVRPRVRSEFNQLFTSQSPEADRSRMALDQSDSSSGALEPERDVLVGSWTPRRMSVWVRLAALPGNARSAHSPDLEW